MRESFMWIMSGSQTGRGTANAKELWRTKTAVREIFPYPNVQDSWLPAPCAIFINFDISHGIKMH